MTVRILPFDRHRIPTPLERLAPPAVLARWRDVDRSASDPQLFVADEWAGAALVTARPHTSYLKIVDAIGAVDVVVEAVVEHARNSGLVQVKWEGGNGGGFTPLAPPLVSGPGTDGPATGSVRWLVPGVTVRPVRYYGQTTYYTCGAVTALAALGEPPSDAEAELAFWKEATNHPACEPVGLGVAVARARPDLRVTIALDTDEPVLLEHLSGSDREWRAGLQRASREEAGTLHVLIASQRLSIAALAGAVAEGAEVLLLISLARMRDLPVPHWVRCSGVAGDTVVLDDPAVDPEHGESWVDGHLLPVTTAELDAMAAYGPGGYRGAVLLRDGTAPP